MEQSRTNLIIWYFKGQSNEKSETTKKKTELERASKLGEKYLGSEKNWKSEKKGNY